MKKIIAVCIAISCLWVSQSFASEMRIAYVDIKVSMENTKAYKQGVKRFEALQNKKRKQLDAKRKKLTDLDKELQMQSMAMTSEHLMEKQQELTRLKKEFDRDLQDATDELKGEKRQLDKTMFGKFYNAVKDYGKKHKFDIILPRSAIIYGSEPYDITADITKILDHSK